MSRGACSWRLQSAPATIDVRVTEGFHSEAFRAALEIRIKPKLRALEIQTAESINSVTTKIAEIEAMRAELDRRLGSSTKQLEAMRVAGNEAFQAQADLDEARRPAAETGLKTAEAGLAQNTARLAEIQEAMAVALRSLDQFAQCKIDDVVSQVDKQLRFIRESIAGASQGLGGGGYGGDGGSAGTLVNPRTARSDTCLTRPSCLTSNTECLRSRFISATPVDGVEHLGCCATCAGTSRSLTTAISTSFFPQSPRLLAATTRPCRLAIGPSTPRRTNSTHSSS